MGPCLACGAVGNRFAQQRVLHTMAYAVLFPGQGSQHVGMGSDLFAARPDLLGEQADRVLGWSLSALCASGPEEELTRTDRAQPALYAVSYALWEEFRATVAEPPAAAAGHSLGEYTALAAAGVFSYPAGLALVAARGAAMAAAGGEEPSGMAALVGTDTETAESIASARREDGGRLWVANSNAPGQVVVAGSAADIEWVAATARDLGVRRAIPLKVAGAFHSPFMAGAADALRAALDATAFGPATFPVYANTTSRPMEDPAQTLAEQLVSQVRFAESLQQMAADGIDTFVHMGPGDVTAGMARRTVQGARVLSVSTIEDVAAAAGTVAVQ